MATNTKYNKQEAQRYATHVQCSYKPDLYSVALRIERALTEGLIYVRVRFEYVDRNDPSFNQEDWAYGIIDFDEFETVANYLIYEFSCIGLKDIKPLKRKPCFHTVDAVFTRRGGTL